MDYLVSQALSEIALAYREKKDDLKLWSPIIAPETVPKPFFFHRGGASRWSERKMARDQRERQPKGYTHHEVVAPRAVGPSGRTEREKIIQKIFAKFGV
ncbi:hypothetical protein [Tunturibacter empetritectus]|uniref:Uncharacterized protein n=1 Tax=Tunturiibacter lichenicola TaxID=2051959 RepID=A0A7W8J9A4_9BACT|nr:hypothetical protein [Edaphobacter lichenicola]MBB5343851.1 hypothetical protein [Edaphobacter lichenicola]